MANNQTLKDLAVSDTGFVFDPHSGASFSTNAAGLEILAGLKAGKTRKEIMEGLVARFDMVVSSAEVERDIDEFVHLLRRNHVVAVDFNLE